MSPCFGIALAAHFDEDDDEEGTMQEALQQTNDPRIPLQVIPKEAMYSVPQVFGLDECFYRWDAGCRLAARAEGRLMQDVRRKHAELGKRPATVQENARGCSDTRGCKEVLHQPGTSGSSLILWNLNKGISTDFGASQLRKRRQKLTDDLLRAIVISQRDPFALVSWWFGVFEHYADPPEVATLPALPEQQRDDDWFAASGSEESPTSSQPSKRGFSATRQLRRGQRAGTGGSCCAQSRPASASGCSRPRLRGARGGAGADLPRRRSVDREKCEQRRSQLSKSQAASLQDFGAEIDLCHRLRSEEFDEQKFSDWSNAFESIQKAVRDRPRRRQPANSRSTPARTTTRNMTQHYIAKIHDRVTLRKTSGGDESSSATCSEEELDLAAHVPHYERLKLPSTANEIMLQCSSLALLDSPLMKKAAVSGPEKKNASYDEVSQIRKKILGSVVPVEMSLSNVATFMMNFGMHRKTVERVAKYLLLGVPSPTRRRPRDTSTDGEKVPFEVFYRLMRSLQGDTKGSGAAASSSPRELSTSMEAWLDSELLRRLVYTALTDHAGTSYTLGAAEQRRADDRQTPIQFSSLFESFRLMLCPQLLYELEYRVLVGEQATDAGESVSGVGFDVQLNKIVEFLLSELHSAEAGGVGSGEHNLANFKVYGSPPVSECGGISYRGFERFVGRWPGVFVDLLRVIMPLAEQGAKFVAEEMHLAQKKLMHRAGELQAKVANQTPRYQRRHIEKLFVHSLEARNARAKV